jgi:hypothetical protein
MSVVIEDAVKSELFEPWFAAKAHSRALEGNEKEGDEEGILLVH